MLRLRVLEILKERRLTKYWLHKRLGLSYQNFNKMVNNETRSIQYDNLEKLCQILQCTPNDIFQFLPDESEDDV